jgi:hypothetical protein
MDYKLVAASESSQKGHTAESVDPKLEPVTSLEASLASLAALAMYTLLLLRLPYRSPLANLLLSAVALSSFYFYLRLRLNIRPPMAIMLCLIVSIALDVVGNRYGLFSKRILAIPYDIITHTVSSGLSFVPVMWLLMKLIRGLGYRLPLGLLVFFSANTTFALAGYYEITELMDERLLGGQRIWTTRDTVQDLAADLTGIIVASICYGLVVRRRWRLDNAKSARSAV